MAITLVFIAGNADDRETVATLLQSFGWRDIIDLGDLTACRAMEQLAPMWIRLNEKFGHVYFNLAVIQARTIMPYSRCLLSVAFNP